MVEAARKREASSSSLTFNFCNFVQIKDSAKQGIHRNRRKRQAQACPWVSQKLELKKVWQVCNAPV